MSYDSRCYDLAEVFLDDEPHLNAESYRTELAQLIQNTIEDFIEFERGARRSRIPRGPNSRASLASTEGQKS